MRKLSLILSILSISLFMTSCGPQEKYADIKASFTSVSNDIDTFAKGVDDSKSAQDLAKAIGTFSDALTKDMANVKQLKDKYKELNETTVPKELEESSKKFMESLTKMIEYMGKVSTSEFASDPAVLAALQKMEGLKDVLK